MARESDKVNQILNTLFERVNSLEDWFRKMDTEGLLKSVLVKNEDSIRFKNFLHLTIVGANGRLANFSSPLSLSNVSHQQEIVMRVIQRLLHRDGNVNNVLCFGFSYMSDYMKASVTSFSSLEYRHPNNSVNRLQSDAWKRLLSRVGDTLMEHLLETTSIFIPLMRPGVYLQLTGEPVYQLWPFTAGTILRVKERKLPTEYKQKPVKYTVMKSRQKRNSSDLNKQNQLKKRKLLEQNRAKKAMLQNLYSQNSDIFGSGVQGIVEPNVSGPGTQSEAASNIYDNHTLLPVCETSLQVTQSHMSESVIGNDNLSSTKQLSSSDVFDRSENAVEATQTHISRDNFDPIISVEDNIVWTRKRKCKLDDGVQKSKRIKLIESELDSVRNSHGLDLDDTRAVLLSIDELLGSQVKSKDENTDLPESQNTVSSNDDVSVCYTCIKDQTFGKGEEGHYRLCQNKLSHSGMECDGCPASESACTGSATSSGVLCLASNSSSSFNSGLLADICKKSETAVSSFDSSHCPLLVIPESSLSSTDTSELSRKLELGTNHVDAGISKADFHTELSAEVMKDAVYQNQADTEIRTTRFPETSARPVATNEKESDARLNRRQKKRMREKRKKGHQGQHRGCTPKSIPYQYHKCISKMGLLYSGVRERFPKCFVLTKLTPVEEGAKALMTSIFHDTNVGGNVMGRNPNTCRCQTSEAAIDICLTSGAATDLVENSARQPAKESDQVIFSNTSAESSKLEPVQTITDNNKTLMNSESAQEIYSNDNEGIGTPLKPVADIGGGIGTPLKPVSDISGGIGTPLKPVADIDGGIGTPLKPVADIDGGIGTPLEPVTDIIVIEDSPQHSSSITVLNSSASSSVSISEFESSVDKNQDHPDRQRSCLNRSVQGGSSADAECMKQCATPFYGHTRVSCDNSSQSSLKSCKASLSKRAVSAGISVTCKEHPNSDVIGEQSKYNEISQSGKDKKLVDLQADGPEKSPSCLLIFQQDVLPLLRQFLSGHRRCPYFNLLKHYCPTLNNCGPGKLPALGRNKAKGPRALCRRWQISHRQPATALLLEDHVPHGKVFEFLKAVVKRVFPQQLLGPSSNVSILLKNIKMLVSAGKYEKVCLGQLMCGIKVKECVWLKNVACQKEKEHHMAQLFWWLFVRFILVVIKTFFYLTDTSILRRRILYYRKHTWMILQSRAVKGFQNATGSQKITEGKTKELLTSGEALGISLIHFIPKSQSLRPIANMSRKSVLQKKSINTQLRNLFQALTFETILDPNIYGCSTFGMDDVHLKLRQFKERRSSQNDSRKLYFVKSDVNKCFDTIKQDKLFEMVKGILTKRGEQTYISRKYTSVHLAGKFVKRIFHQDMVPLSHFQPDLAAFVQRRGAPKHFHDAILVDQALYQQETASTLLQLLRSHLFSNIVKMGGQHYLQGQGISQGSVLSTLLASIYLAHLEASHHLLPGPDELLLRRMDDSLFVTPDGIRARQFLKAMVQGFPDYNCTVNIGKILTNFPANEPVSCIEMEGVFPWCGMLISTSTLEVSIDYTRYSGLCIEDIATFDSSYRAGQNLKNRLLKCLNMRVSACFFDPLINSSERILVNIYQAFLYIARLFHSFVNKLPAARRVSGNPMFFFKTIESIPNFLHALIMKKMKMLSVLEVFPVLLTEIQWLNVEAFMTSLHQHPGYKPLKKLLKSRGLSLQRKLGTERTAFLKEVRMFGVEFNTQFLIAPKV